MAFRPAARKIEQDPELARYSRQILFAPVGEEGQRRLLASRVTLIGCGALGSTLANLLVRAGVGFLRIVDRDYLELSNLQRQSLFDEDDVAGNLPKAEAARRKLAASTPRSRSRRSSPTPTTATSSTSPKVPT
jgi:adenylyltransferase/sulfurtransferase